MQILEKPIQESDWIKDISCNECKAKLSISGVDVLFAGAGDFEPYMDAKRRPEFYYIDCIVCHDVTKMEDLPWSVQEGARCRYKIVEREKNDRRRLEEEKYSKDRSFKRLLEGLFLSFILLGCGSVAFYFGGLPLVILLSLLVTTGQ